MTKVSVNLTEDDIATLKALSDERKVSFAQALRQAIANERFFASELRQGAKILVERNGSLREVVFR